MIQTLTASLDAIPPEITRERRWLIWRYVERDGTRTKMPHFFRPSLARDEHGNPLRWLPTRASATDPRTWMSHDIASAIVARWPETWGLGFVLGDGFVGVDLDHVIDPATGECVNPHAREVLARLAGVTYAEISPSGTGIKILARGRKPGSRCRTATGDYGFLELYDHGRFFTLTGRRWNGSPSVVADCQQQIDGLYADVFPDSQEHESIPSRVSTRCCELPDDEILRRILNSRQGAKFARLWGGDLSLYGGDHSAADLALLGMLMWWCDNDTARVDALFRQSGLMRSKWRKRDDYRESSLRKAWRATTRSDGEDWEEHANSLWVRELQQKQAEKPKDTTPPILARMSLLINSLMSPLVKRDILAKPGGNQFPQECHASIRRLLTETPTCQHPLRADFWDQVRQFREGVHDCGACDGCRRKRAVEWYWHLVAGTADTPPALCVHDARVDEAYEFYPADQAYYVARDVPAENLDAITKAIKRSGGNYVIVVANTITAVCTEPYTYADTPGTRAWREASSLDVTEAAGVLAVAISEICDNPPPRTPGKRHRQIRTSRAWQRGKKQSIVRLVGRPTKDATPQDEFIADLERECHATNTAIKNDLEFETEMETIPPWDLLRRHGRTPWPDLRARREQDKFLRSISAEWITPLRCRLHFSDSQQH